MTAKKQMTLRVFLFLIVAVVAISAQVDPHNGPVSSNKNLRSVATSSSHAQFQDKKTDGLTVSKRHLQEEIISCLQKLYDDFKYWFIDTR